MAKEPLKLFISESQLNKVKADILLFKKLEKVLNAMTEGEKSYILRNLPNMARYKSRFDRVVVLTKKHHCYRGEMYFHNFCLYKIEGELSSYQGPTRGFTPTVGEIEPRAVPDSVVFRIQYTPKDPSNLGLSGKEDFDCRLVVEKEVFNDTASTLDEFRWHRAWGYLDRQPSEFHGYVKLFESDAFHDYLDSPEMTIDKFAEICLKLADTLERFLEQYKDNIVVSPCSPDITG